MLPVDVVLTALREALPHLSAERGTQKLVGQHLGPLAARITQIGADGPGALPPPRLAAEITPPLAEAWSPLDGWWGRGAPDPVGLAAALEAAGIAKLLVLLGQRVTPASLTDVRAIPPTRATLITSAETTLDNGLTTAGRAWTKHAGRSQDPWWGTPRGTVAEKNSAARALLVRILAAATWWNVFGHASHQLVYEARIATGHGARWSDQGQRFVGFLDPFDSNQRY